MKVIFSADAATVDYGFQAVYETAQCGGVLTSSSGNCIDLVFFFIP